MTDANDLGSKIDDWLYEVIRKIKRDW